ncbi:hypothetical protein LCGC14_2014460 [marine sediment metagenome]|uniref:Uncharacterized protein n=1 Tax=marine sediment metagenome TaxID=412755 RepID=A0A0F9HWJ9_9ZZZZ
MRKIITILIVTLFLVVPCFGQPLDTKEQEYAEAFIFHYSGQIKKFPKDTAKYWGYINGDMATKRTYLKAYVQDVLLPSLQLSKNQLEVGIIKTTDKITELEDYVKP